MSIHGLSVIEHTVHTTHEWVNELTDRLDWTHQSEALRLLRITLHRIRDHMQVDELAQFSAQLPILIRGMMFEGWVPKRTPLKVRKADDFFKAIEAEFGQHEDYRGHEDICTVFKLLNARISRGEIEDIRGGLSEDIRAYWPNP